jgi:hypothetical protein
MPFMLLAVGHAEEFTVEEERLPAHFGQVVQLAGHFLACAQVGTDDDVGARSDKGPAAVARFDDVLGGEHLIGGVDGLDRNAELASQLAHTGDFLPRRQQAILDELSHLPADLLVCRLFRPLVDLDVHRTPQIVFHSINVNTRNSMWWI